MEQPASSRAETSRLLLLLLEAASGFTYHGATVSPASASGGSLTLQLSRCRRLAGSCGNVSAAQQEEDGKCDRRTSEQEKAFF